MIDLKAFRKENKISQQELADFAGVTQGAVSQWESGATSIPLTILERLINNGRGWGVSHITISAPAAIGTISGNGNSVAVGGSESEKIMELKAQIKELKEDNRRYLNIIEQLSKRDK